MVSGSAAGKGGAASSRGSSREVGGTGVWCFVNEIALFLYDLVKLERRVGEECRSAAGKLHEWVLSQK